MLGEALTTAGVPTASLWAAVPTYTAQLTAAKATAVLVRAVCTMVGAAVPATALAAAIADYESRVADLLEDDKLAAYVRRLEEAMPLDDDADGAGDELLGELDVDDDSRLVAEVEQFLRESGDSSTRAFHGGDSDRWRSAVRRRARAISLLIDGTGRLRPPPNRVRRSRSSSANERTSEAETQPRQIGERTPSKVVW